MASKIDQYLNKILSSRFGKDVRQSIHDGIKQCYSDVTNPDLNVDAFETAVQNKIDSGELAAMTIADGSITKAKLSQDIADEIDQNSTDVSDLKSALPDKLDTNQGAENKGKSMVVGEDGGVIPVEFDINGKEMDISIDGSNTLIELLQKICDKLQIKYGTNSFFTVFHK